MVIAEEVSAPTIRVAQENDDIRGRGELPAADAYALGLLLNATFNPDHHPPATALPPHPPPTAAARGNIPNTVFPLYKRLLNPNAKGRLTAKGFLEIGMAKSGFFASNRLVKVCLGLDNFALASEAEKMILLRYARIFICVRSSLTPP